MTPALVFAGSVLWTKKIHRTELNQTMVRSIFRLWLPKFGVILVAGCLISKIIQNRSKTGWNQLQLVKRSCVLHSLVTTFITFNLIFGSSKMVKNWERYNEIHFGINTFFVQLVPEWLYSWFQIYVEFPKRKLGPRTPESNDIIFSHAQFPILHVTFVQAQSSFLTSQKLKACIPRNGCWSLKLKQRDIVIHHRCVHRHCSGFCILAAAAIALTLCKPPTPSYSSNTWAKPQAVTCLIHTLIATAFALRS